MHVSQAVFASLLNTSVSTVRKWEMGDKRPSGPPQKLLDLMERKGSRALSGALFLFRFPIQYHPPIGFLFEGRLKGRAVDNVRIKTQQLVTMQ